MPIIYLYLSIIFVILYGILAIFLYNIGFFILKFVYSAAQVFLRPVLPLLAVFQGFVIQLSPIVMPRANALEYVGELKQFIRWLTALYGFVLLELAFVLELILIIHRLVFFARLTLRFDEFLQLFVLNLVCLVLYFIILFGSDLFLHLVELEVLRVYYFCLDEVSHRANLHNISLLSS